MKREPFSNIDLPDDFEDEVEQVGAAITPATDLALLDPATRQKVMTRQAEVIKEKILAYAYKNGDKIAKQLVNRALSDSDQALKELLERTLGKVKEDITLRGQVDHIHSVSDDRFNQIIQVRAKRIANAS